MSDPALLSLAEARSVAPRELLQACRARIEQWQPRINAFIEVHENPSGGRAARTQGHVLQGGAGVELRLEDPARLGGERNLRRPGAARRGGLRRPRPAQHVGIRLRAHRAQRALRRLQESLEPRLHYRRLLQRLGRGGRRAARVRRARLGYRRLGAPAGGGLRHHRPQDHLGPRPAARRDAAFAFARHDRAARAQRRGLRDPAAGDRRGRWLAGKRAKLRIAIASAWIERNAEPEVAAAVLAAAKTLDTNPVEVEPPRFRHALGALPGGDAGGGFGAACAMDA